MGRIPVAVTSASFSSDKFEQHRQPMGSPGFYDWLRESWASGGEALKTLLESCIRFNTEWRFRLQICILINYLKNSISTHLKNIIFTFQTIWSWQPGWFQSWLTSLNCRSCWCFLSRHRFAASRFLILRTSCLRKDSSDIWKKLDRFNGTGRSDEIFVLLIRTKRLERKSRNFIWVILNTRG